MKEEKTKSKKKLIYSIILAVSVLLLVAATVLTVYFVTQGNRSVLDNKEPIVDPNDPSEPGQDDPEPSEPSGGESVRFIAPLPADDISEYNAIFTNTSVGGVISRHEAVDIAAEAGTAVRAMADGTVEKIIYNEYTGNEVIINHGDDICTCYRFVEPAADLRVGQKVKQGDTIATVAEACGTEKDLGSHLHLEMKLKGKNIDPTEYLVPVSEEK